MAPLLKEKEGKKIVKYAFSIQWVKKVVIEKFRNSPNSEFGRGITSR